MSTQPSDPNQVRAAVAGAVREHSTFFLVEGIFLKGVLEVLDRVLPRLDAFGQVRAFAGGNAINADVAWSGNAYTILAGGGVGTYTTFSTWMLESHRAGEGGDARVLWANIAVSLVAGLAAIALGHWIGGWL